MRCVSMSLDREAQWYQQQAAPQLALSHCQMADRSRTAERLVHGRVAFARSPDTRSSIGRRTACWSANIGSGDRTLNVSREHLQSAVELEPSVAEYHFKLATVDLLGGRREVAEAGLRRALELDGQFARAHTALARLLQQQNKLDEAADHLQQALAVDPKLTPAHVYLGVIRVQQRRLPEAEASFRAALELTPDLADAQENLANVLMAQRKTAEAIGAFQATLRLNPRSQGAAMKLAWCLATSPDDQLRSGAEAVRLATAVVKATQGSSPIALRCLGRRLRRERSVRRGRGGGEDKPWKWRRRRRCSVAKVFRERLGLYQQKRPYREPR